MTALVELTIEDKVATVTLNRPEVRNAIDDAMRTEFIATLDRVAADEAVRAMVLTGKGKAFCAGGDIAGMQERLKAPAGEVGFNGWRRQQRTHQASQSCCTGCRKPVIAAVNGPASGLGCDMALACDFIMAIEAAVFTMSFIQRGLVPDGGGMYFLPRRVGLPRAKELIFTGRRWTRRGAGDRARRPHGQPRTRCSPTPRPGPPSSATARPPRSPSPRRSWTGPSSCPRSRSSRWAARHRRSATPPASIRNSVAAFLNKTDR